MKLCPKCHLEYDDDCMFCNKCGSKLVGNKEEVYCQYCGKSIEAGSEFCQFCGKALKQKKSLNRVISSVRVNKVNTIQEDKTTIFHWIIIVFLFLVNLIFELFAYHFTGMLRIQAIQEQLGYKFTGMFLLRDMLSLFQVFMLNIVFCLLLYCSWRIVKYYNRNASKIFGLTFVSYFAIIFCFSFGFIAGFLLFLILMYLVKDNLFERLVKINEKE